MDLTQAGTTYAPVADLPEGSIYWRVSSLDSAGNESAFSSASSFTEDRTAPAVPVLTAVAPDPTRNPRPSLSWAAVSGAAQYHLQVSTVPTFQTTLVDLTQAGTTYAPVADLPEGSIYWRVSSLDSAGNESAFSAASTFTEDRTAPGVPVLTAVSPDPTSKPRPVLAWSTVSGAAQYHLQVSTVSTFLTTLVDQTPTGTTYSPVADLPEGLIYWRVSSKDSAGNESAFSAASSFTEDRTAPGVPVLTAVTPDPTSNPRPVLAWSSISGAVRYHLQISTIPTFLTTLVDQTPTGTAYTPVADLPEGLIYWRVSSQDSAGNESAFSAASSFTEDRTAPGVPVLTAVTPDPTSNPRPALAWSSVSGAAQYHLQISTVPTFLTTLVDQTPTGTSYTPVADLPEGLIYWRVSSKDSAGNESAFSTASSFTEDRTAPGVPVLTAVAPDPTLNPRPVLAWSTVSGAAQYHLQVSTVPTFLTTLVDQTPTGTTYTPVVDLPEGLIYWRVSSKDSAGNESAFSAASSFTEDRTAPAVPVLTAVTPDPTSNPRPVLVWSSVSGATRYHLQVSTAPTFQSTLVDLTQTGTTYTPVADLPEGLIYWRVSALDSTGNESAFSAASSFTEDRTAPPAVSNLRVDWNSPGVVVTWASFPPAVTDIASLRIYRAEAPFSDITGRTPLATLSDPAAVRFDDAGAAHGVMHYYAVTAVDRAGNEQSTAASVPTPPPGGDLYTVPPCRVLDTRNAVGAFGGPALAGGATRSFALAGLCGVPATARAAVFNVTVVGSTAAGYLRGYAGGIPAPGVTTINFSTGQLLSNNALIGLAQDGHATFVLDAGLPTGATVNVVVDVYGYFE